MDILNEDYGAQTVGADTPMTNLVYMPEQPSVNYPQGAIRNRAATSALLQENPNNIVDSYQQMVAEGQDGSSVTHDSIKDAIAAHQKTGAMKGVISILGDKTIPLAQKQKLLNFVKTSDFKEEPAQTLRTNSLQAPSKGEDMRGEAARISVADMLGEMQADAEKQQKAMNAFMATHPEVNVDPAMIGQLAETDVMPFGRNIMTAKLAAEFNKKQGIPTSLGDWVKNFLTPGSTKRDIQNKLNMIPIENRDAFRDSLLSAIPKSATVFHNDNYYAQYRISTELLDRPLASKSEAWTENMMTVLDALWVGGEVKSAYNSLKRAAKTAPTAAATGAGEKVHPAEWELVQDKVPPSGQIPSGQKRIPYKSTEDTVKRLELGAVARRENAVSPYNIIEQVNPAQAKAMQDTMVNAGDEVAMAMTGVNKEQAIANTIVPQVGTDSGAVLAKANMELEPFMTSTGATRYTAEELQGAVDTVVHDFRAASGLKINDAMTTFRVEGDKIAIDAHYTTSGGAWVTPDAARSQAEYALRQYGIRSDEIQVLERSGNEYVPAINNVPGDYIIKVKTRHQIKDSEVVQWNPLDVKRNWLDRFAVLGTDEKGSLAGSLFDPGSMLHPTLTGSMSVATDQAITLQNVLLNPIKDLRDMMTKLPRERRAAIEEYFKEANANGIKFDHLQLKARGFNDQEVAAIKQWRDVWDGHYYLENLDLVKTMNSQGYKIIDNKKTKLFAKPIPKNQNIGKVYDPTTDTVRSLTTAEMDSLYNQGGTYGKLRRPTKVNGETVEHVMVRNTPSEYLRTIRETDPILNYREGYYTVNYKAPHFIDQVYFVDGKEARRTIGVADNMKDAEMFRSNMEASTGERHVVRADNRGFRKDADSYWDLHESSGRIAQRMRGKPLVEASGQNALAVGPHVENPMESVVRAARSIAGRTVMRSTLETAKARFVKQYEQFLKPTAFGDREFPNRIAQIVDEKGQYTSAVADARTTWRYIQFMEQGYINSADELFKGGMSSLADMLGKYNMSMAEKAARKVAEVSPTKVTKGTVFYAYIALSNPVRQWIVQSHQMIRTFAYNPIGWLSGKIEANMVNYLSHEVGFETSKAGQSFYKFVKDSGMLAGVDQNSIVRGMGLDMADATYGARHALEVAKELPRRFGFDIGEKMNQLGHLSAVYEQYERSGKNLLNPTIRDQAYAEARALSYDLNKAGELHYTQGSAAAILQFQQMPQKAILQIFNRKLPWDVRARLAGWDLIMWGGLAGATSSLLFAAGKDGDDVLPNDPKLREIITDGAESYALNEFISSFDDSGEKTRIDFSALAPYDLQGWAKMYSAMMSDGTLGMIAASPAGQLFAVDGTGKSTRNGRIPQALLTMGRFFNVFEEIDPQNPTEFTAVLNDVAKISSGWNAASKATIMLETRKKFSALGVSVDSELTNPEIAAAFLGFSTKSEKELYETTKFISESKKKHEQEVMTRYRDILTYYANNLNTPNADVEHIQKVSSMLMRTFTDPDDLKLVHNQWQKDMVGKDGLNVFLGMSRAVKIPTIEGAMDKIKTAPLTEQQKTELINRLKDLRSQREYNKANEGK